MREWLESGLEVLGALANLGRGYRAPSWPKEFLGVLAGAGVFQGILLVTGLLDGSRFIMGVLR